MFDRQMILEQLGIKNDSELCGILKRNLKNINITIDFDVDHNYYKISGMFYIDSKFWELRDTLQVNSKNTNGNKAIIKTRKDSLIKDRKFEMYKGLCHRGHLIAKQFKPYIAHFNFSKNNPDNIYPQWINANLNKYNNSGIYGQAYFEDKVINLLKKGEKVLYKVVPIFKDYTEDYPIGNVLIAVSDNNKDEVLDAVNSSEYCINCYFDKKETNRFCVFIPNYLDTCIII